MPKDAFEAIFYRFSRAISELEIVAAVSAVVLTDYPRNLPADMKDSLAQTLVETAEVLHQAAAYARANGANDSAPTLISLEPKFDPIARATIGATAAAVKSGTAPLSFDLVDQVLAQQVVTSFAHLDAFLNDMILAVCEAQPRVLAAKKRSMDWQTIVDAGGWQKLIELMSQSYALEFGMLSLKKRFARIESRLGVDFRLPDDIVDGLFEGEAVRHLLVHTGGKISVTFIERTGSQLAVGTKLHLTLEQVRRYTRCCVAAGEGLLRGLLTKGF